MPTQEIVSTKSRAPSPVRGHEWQVVRDAYVNAEERPTFAELETRFTIPEASIARAAADQGWLMMRAKKYELALREMGAAEAIAVAIKTDEVLVKAATNTAMTGLQSLNGFIIELTNPPTGARARAVSTRIQSLNDASFCFANLCRGLKDLGVSALPAKLKAQADPGNGSWNPQMLTALNITVQNLLNKPSEAQAELPAGAHVSAQPAVNAAE